MIYLIKAIYDKLWTDTYVVEADSMDDAYGKTDNINHFGAPPPEYIITPIDAAIPYRVHKAGVGDDGMHESWNGV